MDDTNVKPVVAGEEVKPQDSTVVEAPVVETAPVVEAPVEVPAEAPAEATPEMPAQA
ncbi:MAG: hypothetical protein WA051_01815 [Minisyncoccia bacterium]